MTTSRTPRLRGRIWPIFGFFAILGLWVVSAGANFYAGTSISDDPSVSFVLGMASVCVDVLKAISLFIVASAIVHKRWTVVFVALASFFLCAAWSMRSATHFASMAMTTKAADLSLKSDLQKASLDLLSIKTRRAEFLSQQSITIATGEPLNIKNKKIRADIMAENGRARSDTIGENQRLSTEFAGLVKDIERQKTAIESKGAVIHGDPVAALFGLDDRSVILISAMFFATLLEFLSGFGFWMLAQSRRPRPEVVPEIKDVTPKLPEVSATPDLQAPTDPGPGLPAPTPVLDVKAEEPTAEEPPPQPNVISIRKAQKLGLQSIVRENFEPGEASDRMLLRAVVDLVNAQLPKSRRIVEPHLVAKYITPVITEDMDWPNAVKRKIGGRTYILGIRPRSFDNRRKVA